jgi:uncharacterized protein YeaC (DUF1315 family)
MEKVLWDTLVAPALRQQLIRKYVPPNGSVASIDRQLHGTSIEGTNPKEPTDPLIYRITAFYWLLQELVGNWKAGKRLTLDQKSQLLQLLVWNISILQQEQAAYEAFAAADIGISQETTEQIANLVLACKEFQS